MIEQPGQTGLAHGATGTQQNVTLSKMEIAELSITDIESIKPLWELLNKTHHDNTRNWQSYFKKFTFDKRIQKIRYSQHAAVFVAKNNNDLIGYCIVSTEENIGEIDSIYIQENYRKTGIGKQLIRTAENWFQQNGINEIKIAIVEGNEAVFPFYEQFGFKKFMTILKR